MEQLTPDSSAALSGTEEMREIADIPGGQTVQDWEREEDGSYDALQHFSHQLMLENMEEVNPVLSPLSAYLALSMAACGAEGDTAAEVEALLGADHERV